MLIKKKHVLTLCAALQLGVTAVTLLVSLLCLASPKCERTFSQALY